MPSLSEEIREIADHLKRLAVNSKCGINAHRLFDIADRLEGRCVVEPIIRRSRYGTWEVKLPVCTAETQFGDGAEAVAALQAELDKQESSPTTPTPQE